MVSHSKLLAALLVGLTAAACGGTRNEAKSAEIAPEKREAARSRLNDATEVLRDVAGNPDRPIAREVVSRATCVAVVPALVQGGVLLGAKHGRGVVTCRTATGWSPPGFFTISGGSAGLQIGAQSVDLVMIATSERAKRAFTEREFQLGGDVSASAGPVGRGRASETNTSLRSEIVCYSHARGLFAGVELGGAAISHDEEASRAFYGTDESLTELLTRAAPAPAPADVFVSRVEELFRPT